jgi:hypothetical protein
VFVGGWNNNPNIIQFRAAFRKLISRCGAEASTGRTGNVTEQEELLMVQSIPYSDPFVEDSVALPSVNNISLGNAVVYIVFRKVLIATPCDNC